MHRLSLIVHRVLSPEMGSFFLRRGAFAFASVSFECKGNLDFDQLDRWCCTIETVDWYGTGSHELIQASGSGDCRVMVTTTHYIIAEGGHA